MRLEGKVALVIGASRGMGKQIALQLAREGANVAIAARTEKEGQASVSGSLSETAREISALGRDALQVKVDLADRQQIEEMYSRAFGWFGRIDILVHSVQYMGPGYISAFLDTSVEQLELQIKVNLLSAMHATKLAATHMTERGGGRILLISSAAGSVENPNLPGHGSTGLGYPVTKAGINRFVWALAKELTPHNVSVIAVDPGFTLSEHVREGAVDDVYHGWPLSWAHSVDVPANTVRYLCTTDDPMSYSGKVVVAEDFVKKHDLLPA
jgi:NAD(P)-dependent dehydrogenase (short-subunit alcohol dehydrogenase family)